MEQPDDGVPALAGVQFQGRFFLTDDTFAGGALGWSGGADDRNPERVLLTQKAEAVALLGYRLGLGDGVGVLATARTGVIGIDGWPRGNLPRLQQFAPIVGAELSVVVQLGRMWGHGARALDRIQRYANRRCPGRGACGGILPGESTRRLRVSAR